MADRSPDKHGGAESPVPADSPLMVAWEAYKKTEAYANSLKWALLQERGEDVVGALWSAFSIGFLHTHHNASPIVTPRSPTGPRTKAQCLEAVVKELSLDTTDPFTRILAAAFALQDAYEENRAALARCQETVHRLDEYGTQEEHRLVKELEAVRSAIAPKWIPRSERMPEPLGNVLVHVSGSECDYTAMWDGKAFCCWRSGHFINGVTHWMPLPSSPNNSSDGGKQT